MKLLRVLLFGVLIAVTFSLPSSCTFRGGDEQGQITGEVSLPPCAQEIGLIFQIGGLDIENLWETPFQIVERMLDEQKVSSEFASTLQSKIAKQGYKIIPVKSEEEATVKGLANVLRVNYAEVYSKTYNLNNGTYQTWPASYIRGQVFKGTRVIATFEGWDSTTGWGLVFALSAETSERVKKTSRSGEQDLRQDAIENFWQRFPERLPETLFLGKSVAAEEKWNLQINSAIRQEGGGLPEFEPQIAGNMLLIYTEETEGNFVDLGRLNVIDMRSGERVREFREAHTAVDRNMVFIHSRGRLYALDCLTGAIQWELAGSPAYLPSLADSKSIPNPYLRVVGTEVYVAYVVHELYKEKSEASGRYRVARLDKSTGHKVWETNWENVTAIQEIAEDTVFLFVTKGEAYASTHATYALDRETGDTRWGPKPLRVLATSGDIVLAQEPGAPPKLLHALDPGKGEDIWSRDWPYLPDRFEILDDRIYEFYTRISAPSEFEIQINPPSGPRFKKKGVGVVYYHLNSYDLDTGEVLWVKIWPGYDPRTRNITWGMKSDMWWEQVDDYTIRCVDFRSGDVKWERKTGFIYSFSVDTEQQIVLLASPKLWTLIALDATNGNELWRFEPSDLPLGDDGRYIVWDPGNDQVFVKARENYRYTLYSLGRDSGEIMWRVPIEESYRFEAFKDRLILLTEHDRFSNISAFDASSGQEKWTLGLPMLLRTSDWGLLKYEGLVKDWDQDRFVTTDGVYGEDGDAYRVEVKRCLVDKYLAGETLYVQASDSVEKGSAKPNYVLAIDLDTGQLKWYYKTEGTIKGILWADENGVCIWIAHTSDGNTTYYLRYLTGKD